MRIRYIHVLFMVIIIIGGGIWLTSQAGLFNTTRSGRTNPFRNGGRGQSQLLLNESVEVSKDSENETQDIISEVNHDIAEIRGSFSLVELEQYYRVPSSSIIEAFALEKDTNPSSFRLRDLKEIYLPVEINGEMYEVETDTVKVFVSLYSDIPYTSEETTHLPEQAVNYLLREDKLAEDEINYWENHTFNLLLISGDTEIQKAGEEGETVSTNTEKQDSEIVSIVGRTTIVELLSMGIDAEEFQEITGLEVPNDKSISIRDYALSQGFDFGEIRGGLEFFLSSHN